MSILSFFRKSEPSEPFTGDDAARMKLYKKLRFQSFIAGTVGYSLYYVCRTSLNVVKKPILESGALDATQLGIIGSALLLDRKSTRMNSSHDRQSRMPSSA